jgi:hypothetical protein
MLYNKNETRKNLLYLHLLIDIAESHDIHPEYTIDLIKAWTQYTSLLATCR